METPMVKTLQLIGSLVVWSAAATAVTWYVVLWPFDRASR